MAIIGLCGYSDRMTTPMPVPTTTATQWVPDDSTFGARLALIRQRMGWGNVAQAARECGVPVGSWHNWEEGMEPRRLVTIAMAIASRTGVDVDWLVYGPKRADLLRRAELTLRYVSDVLAASPVPHPALDARTVKHGDGRRSPIGLPSKARPAHPPRTKRRQVTPVSQPAMA